MCNIFSVGYNSNTLNVILIPEAPRAPADKKVAAKCARQYVTVCRDNIYTAIAAGINAHWVQLWYKQSRQTKIDEETIESDYYCFPYSASSLFNFRHLPLLSAQRSALSGEAGFSLAQQQITQYFIQLPLKRRQYSLCNSTHR